MTIFIDNFKSFKVSPDHFLRRINWQRDILIFVKMIKTTISSKSSYEACIFLTVDPTRKIVMTIIVGNFKSFKMIPNDFLRRSNWKRDIVEKS